jgi:quercetin dioxygenase-like cupin family protein
MVDTVARFKSMKIIKRDSNDITKEEAHGGSGSRKVYASPEHLTSTSFEAMTHGYLPAGGTFDWHDHTDIEEIMVVVKGSGEVHDQDGVYVYEPGDVFVYPANIKHKIHNPTTEEHEMIFVRVKV